MTAAEARLRQAEQETLPSQTSPTEFAKQQPEFAKQQEAQAHTGEVVRSAAETVEANDQKTQLRAIASDLLYWKGGLNVLRQAQLPKWRGYFKWQIEAKIEALQTAYAKLHAEVATPEE